MLFAEVILEVTAVAKFHSYELCVFSGKTFDESNDVLILALPQDPYLGSYELLKLWSLLHENFRNGLDSYISIGILIKGFIDYSPGALSQDLHEVVAFHLSAQHVLVLQFIHDLKISNFEIQ